MTLLLSLVLLFCHHYLPSALVFSLSSFHINSLRPAIPYYLNSVCIDSVSRWSYDRPVRACGDTRMKIIISREIRNEVKTEHNCENDDPYNTKIWRHPEFFPCLSETASKIALDLNIRQWKLIMKSSPSHGHLSSIYFIRYELVFDCPRSCYQ